MRTHPNINIFHLPENHVFVFGSNKAGRHGKGAAKTALKLFGAKYGKGEGLARSKDAKRMSYAIPTKDHYLSIMSIEEIKEGVERFIDSTRQLQYLTFFITAVGTGLAEYSDEDIAPLFRGIGDNCIVPEQWLNFLQ